MSRHPHTQGSRPTTHATRYTSTIADRIIHPYNATNNLAPLYTGQAALPPNGILTSGTIAAPYGYSTLSNYDGNSSFMTSSLPLMTRNSYPSSAPRQDGPNMDLYTGRSCPSSPTSPRSPLSSKSSQTGKSYRCDTCGACFTRAHDRKRHLSIHNRPPDGGPKCEYCEKTFSRGDALKRHMDNGCDAMPDSEYELRLQQQRQQFRGTSP